MNLNLGRNLCRTLETAQEREWLVTNGIGGYACGTVAGLLTRSYHGLLIAALKPPLERTLLLTKINETVAYQEQLYHLASDRWQNNLIEPSGYHYITDFHLEGTIPVWNFTFSDANLQKRIWMQPHANITYIYYTLQQSSQPIKLSLKVLVNCRSHHGGNLATINDQKPITKGVCVTFAEYNQTSLYILADNSKISLENNIHYNFELSKEQERGLPEIDHHWQIATLETTLEQGDSLTLVATTQQPNPLENTHLDLNNANTVAKLLEGATALAQRHQYEQNLLQSWHQISPQDQKPAPDWISQLILAADQFIVDRALDQNHIGKSIIAGYPWFSDWGRDTMISLPGLTLATGRPEIAKLILLTFAQYLNQGMLPNRFPDGNNQLGELDYNTVDATLWYFQAIRSYYAQTGDKNLLSELFPKLQEIIAWHCLGTRYNIKLDPNDGLISAGQKGVQLTWMDAKIDNYVVTPRIGKPIEINALWYNALQTMVIFAQTLGQSAQEYQQMAITTCQGFQRFWNPQQRYCFDILDTPDGQNDASLRPNQIFAVSLPESPLNPEQQRSIVQVCQKYLLTPFGLRSLAPQDAQYQGYYTGNQSQRDRAYHQGTVWGWLLGSFVVAHFRIFHNRQQALKLLEPMREHLETAGLGTISEIFDGNNPYYPRGCIAQAWSVAEILRVYQLLDQNS